MSVLPNPAGLSKRDQKKVRDAAGYILAWFQVENPQLGNATPLELLESGRGHKVAEMVREAIHSSSSD